MQKKSVLTIIILIILFNVFFFLHISNSTIDNWLLNKTIVSFDFTNGYSESISNFLKKVEHFSEENNVEIAQYSFLSADKIDIYSTMKKNYNEMLFVPNVIFNRDIKLHNFHEVLNIGFKNLLYIDTDNESIIKKFSEELNSDCNLSYLKTVSENNNILFNIFFKDSGNNSLPIFSFFIFVFLLIMYFYYSINKKRYLIYKLWGYAEVRIYYILNKPIYVSLLLTMFLSNVLMSLVVYKNIFTGLVSKVFLTMLKLNAITIILIFILSIPLFWLFSSVTNSKKTKGLKKVMIVSYFAKVLALLLVIFLVAQFFSQKQALKEKSEGLTLWESAQNLYNLYESYSPNNTDNLAKEDELNNKIFKVYKELSELDKEFILKTINFERPPIKNPTTEEQEDLDYNYKLNIKAEEDLYSPYGRNIVVDKNYLKRHTIKSSDGKNVLDKIDNNNNVLNIIVPQQLQKHEDIIKTSFKEWFYFQKVEVTNLYKEAKGQIKVEKNINDLKVNIIYAIDDQSFFTYNPNSGDSCNIIKDTIITVYTENVDNSFLASCLGPYIFIESSNEYSALKEVSAITEKYNLIELNSISSVYDKKGEEIRLIEQNISNLKKNTIIMSLFLINFMAIIVYTYYKTFFLTIVIKSLQGYSFWQIFKHLILRNISLNVLVLFLAGVILKKISLYMIVIFFVTSIIDYLIARITNKYLLIKGEIQFIKDKK